MVCGPGSFYCTHVDSRNGENFNKGLLYITSHSDRVRVSTITGPNLMKVSGVKLTQVRRLNMRLSFYKIGP